MKKERILYLDLIRVVSLLMVTSYHFGVACRVSELQTATEWYEGFTRGIWGVIGVYCFFMISGNALYYQYKEKLELKQFYKKRFLSIYPMFWIAYIFVLFANFYITRTIPNASKPSFLLTILGMDGYFHYLTPTYYLVGEWFLGAIIFLYILFPLYRFLQQKNRLLALVPLAAISIYIFFFNPFTISVCWNLIVCSFYFVLGIAYGQTEWKPKVKHVMTILSFLVFTSIVAYLAVLYYNGKNYMHNYYVLDMFLSISLFFLLRGIADLIKSGLVRKIIFSVGKYSFAFYLLHHVIISYVVGKYAGMDFGIITTVLLYVMCLVIIYIAAVLLYRFEKAVVAYCSGERQIKG